MRFLVILILVLLAIGGCVFSSGNDEVLIFEGVIHNTEREPITGVELEISSRKVDVDDNGYFCYEGLHSLVALELSVEAPGYNSLRYNPGSRYLYLNVEMSKINSRVLGSVKAEPLPANIGEDFYCSNK